jgi:hypothetical protein
LGKSSSEDRHIDESALVKPGPWALATPSPEQSAEIVPTTVVAREFAREVVPNP